MNNSIPTNPVIRVGIVDDQRLMREGLRTLLELEDGIEVVGEAEDGVTAINLFSEKHPDVLLMDIRMPGMDGVEATRQIIGRWSEARVVILTTFDDEATVFDGLRAGALGYLLKDVSGQELASAIRKVAQGGALIQPSVARKVLAEFTRMVPVTPSVNNHLIEPLTNREEEILKGIIKGLTNKEIAVKLNLTEGTVKNYVSMIFQKLCVHDRTQAAIRARELRL